MSMTVKFARQLLTDNHLSLRSRDGEYRINFVPGFESTAYYTDDLQDAIDTGLDMVARRTKALIDDLNAKRRSFSVSIN